MQILPVSRRSVLFGFGAMALGLGAVSTSRADSPYTHLRAVKIDVKPLAENGDTISAGVIAETAPSWVPRYFGPHLAPGDARAPILIIRYKTISFGVPGSANGPNGNGAMDYVEGEGVVIGAGGRTIATYPLTSALFTTVDEYDTSGAYTRHRIESLGQALVEFMPGKMGL